MGNLIGGNSSIQEGLNSIDRPEIRLAFNLSGDSDFSGSFPVYGLSSIVAIADPVPLPAALPLLTVAFGGLAFGRGRVARTER